MNAVEEGWIIATAHVRGEGELGAQWHKAGSLENKSNSFYDFLSCAAYLSSEKYSQPDLMAAYGASAGGLLIGQVLNLRPDIFKAAVLDVPFVDVLNIMMDESLPLTVPEREEWGNPI